MMTMKPQWTLQAPFATMMAMKPQWTLQARARAEARGDQAGWRQRWLAPASASARRQKAHVVA